MVWATSIRHAEKEVTETAVCKQAAGPPCPCLLPAREGDLSKPLQSSYP